MGSQVPLNSPAHTFFSGLVLGMHNSTGYGLGTDDLYNKSSIGAVEYLLACGIIRFEDSASLYGTKKFGP